MASEGAEGAEGLRPCRELYSLEGVDGSEGSEGAESSEGAEGTAVHVDLVLEPHLRQLQRQCEAAQQPGREPLRLPIEPAVPLRPSTIVQTAAPSKPC